MRAVSSTWKTEFGITKISFDVSLTVIAGVLSFLFSGRLHGVREGTIIAALLVGFLARLFGRALHFLEPALFGTEGRTRKNAQSTAEQPCPPDAQDSSDSGKTAAAAAARGQLTGNLQDSPDISEGDRQNGKAPVIVIGRQYGSGGHDIGKLLAEKLGYRFYDNEIIQMAAGSTGYSPDFIREKEENMTNSLLYDLVSQVYIYSSEHNAPKDRIFESEAEVIRGFAAEGGCVIVGRCADYILRETPGCFKVYLHAPVEYRIRRIMVTEELSEQAARQKIQQMNRRRADNYHYYTHQMWGHSKNYDLTVSTELGQETVAEIIQRALLSF